MIHPHLTDAETAGRLLHAQLLADARCIVGTWIEEPHPAELREPVSVTSPEVPRTNEMPAVSVHRSGKHRASQVTRIRPAQ